MNYCSNNSILLFIILLNIIIFSIVKCYHPLGDCYEECLQPEACVDVTTVNLTLAGESLRCHYQWDREYNNYC